MSAILGASLLVLAACAPDSLTRGGSAQPAPVERSNDNSAALNANEAGARAAGAPAAASPLQNETEFTGPIEVLASNMWVVGGRTVAVTAATEIKPGLEVGTQAKVHAVRQADGSLWARAVELVGGNGNVNSNDDKGNNNDSDTGNVNSNDDNGNNNNNNDDGNVNSNDDSGNGNVNSNDDNGNDDYGGSGNVNSNDDDGNDDHDGNVNSNDNNGGHGNSNDGHHNGN